MSRVRIEPAIAAHPEYLEARPGATFVPGRSVWEVPCEVALPSATQNEITAEAAAMVALGMV